MSLLVEILLVLFVLAVCFYLLSRYVIPVVPAPWGKIGMAILVVITVIFLLNRYVGLGL